MPQKPLKTFFIYVSYNDDIERKLEMKCIILVGFWILTRYSFSHVLMNIEVG